jgi:cytoskeleton protein RodZ
MSGIESGCENESIMSEKDQIQSEPDLTKEPEEPARVSPGLGAALRAERDKKGMSLDQVASVTKLRTPMLEALENEAWESLPHPVFVRGFIRTYAKVLGADEKYLLSLYEQVMPEKTEPPPPAAVPRRSRKGWYLIPILALVLLGIAFFLWQGYPSSSRKTQVSKNQAALQSAPKNEEKLKAAEPSKPEGEKEVASKQENIPAAAPVPSPDQNKEEPPGTETGLKDDQEKPQPAVAEAQKEPVPAPEEKKDAFVLDAVVVETTWVRISIDGGEPKEYLFNPGFRTQWKAEEGFALLVGNAGGIQLELNGQKLGKLGNPGQVVRLRLPKGYTPTRSVG